MRRFIFLTAIVIILAAVGSPAIAEVGYSLSADAIPTSILADGKSYSQIIMTVTTANGQPAPDGTEIRIASTAGTVTPVAYTSGGRASAILTSTSSPEIAEVTASIDGISASVQVEFISAADDASFGPKIIRMQGGSLAYSVERDTILASDGVTLEYRGLTITAANIQVCERLDLIKGQGNAKISRGDIAVEADAFVYDMRTDRCRTLKVDASNITMLRTDSLRVISISPASESSQQDFKPLEANATKTWIISRKLTLFPGEKIQFTKASVYAGDTRVLSLPHYFYNYDRKSPLLNQVRYTTYEGLIVDMPMYYRVTDSDSGALKLRYAGEGNGYGGYNQPRKGMSLALDQAYSFGEKGEGQFFVDALDSEERSFELKHHQEFGTAKSGGRADLTVRFQPVSAFAKNVFTTYLNAFGAVGKYSYNLSGYMGGSEYPRWNYQNPDDIEYIRQSYSSIRASLRQQRPFLIGGDISVFPNLSIGYGRLGFIPGGTNDPCLYQTLGLNFRSATKGSRTASIGFDGSSDLTMTADGRMGTSLRLGTNYRRSWRNSSANLGYTLNLQSGSVSSQYINSVHTLNGMFSLRSSDKLNCNSFFTYGLDTGRMNLYSFANYRAGKNLRVRADYSFYRYTYKANDQNMSFDTSYLKAGIYRAIGPYEIGLAWSPEGKSFGRRDGKRLWLEVGMSGF